MALGVGSAVVSNGRSGSVCRSIGAREEAMKYASGQRNGGAGRGSTVVALDPYFVEEIGLTAYELAEAGRADVRIVTRR
jgi:hypothetical protein